jgi:hypothetical protein
MFDLKLPVTLPGFDLNIVLAIAAALVVVLLTLAVLVARSIARSRLIAVAAIVALVVSGGGTISGWLGTLTALLVVIGVMAIGVIITLGHNRGVLELVRSLVKPNDPPTRVDRSDRIMPPSVVHQPPPMLNAPATPARLKSRRPPRRHWSKWGF